MDTRSVSPQPHYTLVLEIQKVDYIGGMQNAKTVEETARVVIRDANLPDLISRAMAHLNIMRDSPEAPRVG